MLGKGKSQLKPMPINKMMRKRRKKKPAEILLKTPNWSFTESYQTCQNQTDDGKSKPTTIDPIDNHKAVIQHQLSCCPNKPGSPAATYITKRHKLGRPNTTTDHHLPSIMICGHEVHLPDCCRINNIESKRKKNVGVGIWIMLWL
jgi:hypothetical protein